MCVQRVPVAGETVIGWDFDEPKDGGKGSNQAIASARLGVLTSFVGCVGADRLGVECEGWLREEGIDLRYLFTSKSKSTGVGFIILNEGGVPAMITSMGANEELSCAQVEIALAGLSGAKVMLTQFEIRPEVALYSAKVAHDHHMISIVNPAPATKISLTKLEVADILIPNDREAKVLLGMHPEAKIDLEEVAMELMAGSKARCVIITAGERGILGVDDVGVWQAFPPNVKVMDTSGAGDVFCAAFAVGLTKGLTQRVASKWACQVAALSVTKKGTIPSFPSAAEADEFCSTFAGKNQ
jgi:ribokinase